MICSSGRVSGQIQNVRRGHFSADEADSVAKPGLRLCRRFLVRGFGIAVGGPYLPKQVEITPKVVHMISGADFGPRAAIILALFSRPPGRRFGAKPVPCGCSPGAVRVMVSGVIAAVIAAECRVFWRQWRGVVLGKWGGAGREDRLGLPAPGESLAWAKEPQAPLSVGQDDLAIRRTGIPGEEPPRACPWSAGHRSARTDYRTCGAA